MVHPGDKPGDDVPDAVAQAPARARQASPVMSERRAVIVSPEAGRGSAPRLTDSRDSTPATSSSCASLGQHGDTSPSGSGGLGRSQSDVQAQRRRQTTRRRLELTHEGADTVLVEA